MKKCEICNKEIDKVSPFNTERTHGKCVQNEFRDLLNKELEKQRKGVAKRRKDMLKIKDGVDLNELEKFGFRPYRTIWSSNGDVGNRTVEYSCTFEFGKGNYGQDFQTGVTSLNVDSSTRQLSEYIDERFEMYVDVSRFRLMVLCDLIQAGLVEKVES